MKNMKNELYEKLYEGGIFNVELCDKTERLEIKKLIKEKKPIPEDVYLSPSNGYVRIYSARLNRGRSLSADLPARNENAQID